MLWRDFSTTRSRDSRAALFARYLPLVRGIARRLLLDRDRGDIEYVDLVQNGSVGLLEAIDRFDPTRGVPFAGYAHRRIMGSIVDGIAKTSEHRRQSAVNNRRERERMRSLLPETESAHSPSDAYDVLAELAVGLAFGYMLEDHAALRDGDNTARQGNGYESAAWQQSLERVAAAVEGLSEREQIVVRSHYEGEMRFEEISELLGVTKGRISQLHRSALKTLRKRLGTNGALFIRQ